MRRIKSLRVREERAETGFCTKVNCPAVVIGIREILRVGIVEDPSAKSDKSLRPYLEELCPWEHDTIVLVIITSDSVLPRFVLS